MDKVICVYASSSNLIDDKYFDIAARLGEAIAVMATRCCSAADTRADGGDRHSCPST